MELFKMGEYGEYGELLEMKFNLVGLTVLKVNNNTVLFKIDKKRCIHSVIPDFIEVTFKVDLHIVNVFKRYTGQSGVIWGHPEWCQDDGWFIKTFITPFE